MKFKEPEFSENMLCPGAECDGNITCYSEAFKSFHIRKGEGVANLFSQALKLNKGLIIQESKSIYGILAFESPKEISTENFV